MKKISPAMIMVAVSALTMFAHESGDQAVINIESSKLSDEFSAELDIKMSTAKISSIVARSAPSFVDSITIDGSKVDVQAFLAAADDSTVDSESLGTPSVTCYVNCHDACHGSRSWR